MILNVNKGSAILWVWLCWLFDFTISWLGLSKIECWFWDPVVGESQSWSWTWTFEYLSWCVMRCPLNSLVLGPNIFNLALLLIRVAPNMTFLASGQVLRNLLHKEHTKIDEENLDLIMPRVDQKERGRGWDVALLEGGICAPFPENFFWTSMVLCILLWKLLMARNNTKFVTCTVSSQLAESAWQSTLLGEGGAEDVKHNHPRQLPLWLYL